MALVSRDKNRRKLGARQLFGQAEACETRALLSAAAIDVADAEVVDVVEASIESPGYESPIVDDEHLTFEDCPTDGSEAEPLNPEEFIRFMTMMIAPVPDGLVLPEGGGIGETSFAEEIGPPVDEWDPTWLYQTLISEGETDPEPFEEVGTVDIPTPAAPEGWTDEPWQAWNSGLMTPEQMEQLGIVFEPFEEWNDPSDGPVSEDSPVDGEMTGLPFEYIGPDGELVKEDFDWSWVLRGPADGIEGELIVDDSFVLYPFDLLPWDESFGVDHEFIDVTDGSEPEIVDGEKDGESPTDDSEVLADGGDIPYGVDEPEIYFATLFDTVGGSDMQRSLDEVELPPAPTPIFSSVAPPTTVLFDDRDAAVEVSALIAQTEEPAAAVSEPVPQPVSPVLRSKSRSLSAASVTTESEVLNGLTPLFENSDEPVASEVKPADPEELPSDETVSVIENHDVSNTEGYVAAVRSTPVSGVVRVRNATRSGSVAIDQFMVQYAQNSFMS